MYNIVIKNKPTILINKDFKTIQIKVMFPFENSIANLANMQLLPCLLNWKNNVYKTEESFHIAKNKLFILGYSAYFSAVGCDAEYNFCLSIPNKDVLKNNLLEEQIKFFSECIYNPYIEDNKFNEFDLEREKKNLKLGMDNALKNLKPYQSIKIKELIDDVGLMKRDIIFHRELIDKVSCDSLYRHYCDTILNSQPMIYIMGDVNEKEITDLCNKYLYRENFKEKKIPYQLSSYLLPRNKVKEINEKSNFKDSSISFVYKINNFKDDEYVILNLMRDLLSSLSSRLLNIKLRDENELIYSSKVISDKYYGILEITAFIQKNNLNTVKEKITEAVNDFKNTELIAPLLDNIKDRKRINLLRKLDSKYQIFDDFIIHDLGISDTLEEYYEKVLKVTADDIANFVDKLVLDTIYFIEEEDHE